ncbi:uncharacterized protein LOC115266850 [Aedes albopictus]|uniref:Uncharacterized protein n=1 Tax=Aedes albopictus TaxID=7160 RepID=A0ABM1Z235_AEDAL
MKHFIILVCFLMAFWTGLATGARQQLRSDVVYNERNLKEGRYKYGYAVKQGETQFHHQRSLDGAMYGCYGYVDPLGKLFITHYLADKAGYRLVNLANPDKRLLDRIRTLGSAEHPLELQNQFPLECQADGDIKVLQETAAQMKNTLSAQALQGNVRERSSLSYKTTTSSTSNLKEQVEDKPVNQNQPVAPTVSRQGLKKNLISQADPEVKKTVGNGNEALLTNTTPGTYKTVAVSFKAKQSHEGRNIFKTNVRSSNTGKSFGSPFSMVGSDGSTYIPVAVIDSNDRPLSRLIPLRGAGATWYPTAAFRRSSDMREPASVNTAVETVKANQLIETLKKIEEPVVEEHGVETKNQKNIEAAKVDLEIVQATSGDMGVDEVNKVAVENGDVKTSIDMKHEENAAGVSSDETEPTITKESSMIELDHQQQLHDNDQHVELKPVDPSPEVTYSEQENLKGATVDHTDSAISPESIVDAQASNVFGTPIEADSQRLADEPDAKLHTSESVGSDLSPTDWKSQSLDDQKVKSVEELTPESSIEAVVQPQQPNPRFRGNVKYKDYANSPSQAPVAPTAEIRRNGSLGKYDNRRISVAAQSVRPSADIKSSMTRPSSVQNLGSIEKPVSQKTFASSMKNLKETTSSTVGQPLNQGTHSDQSKPESTGSSTVLDSDLSQQETVEPLTDHEQQADLSKSTILEEVSSTQLAFSEGVDVSLKDLEHNGFEPIGDAPTIDSVNLLNEKTDQSANTAETTSEIKSGINTEQILPATPDIDGITSKGNANDDERSYDLSHEQKEVVSAVQNNVDADESVLRYPDSAVNTNTAGLVHDVPDVVHEVEETVKSAEISNSDFTELSEEPQEQQDIQGRKIDGSVEDINRNGPEKSDSSVFNSEIDTQSGLSAPEVVHIPAIRVPEYVERQVLNTDSNLPSQDLSFSTRTNPARGSQLDSEKSSVNSFGYSARESQGENILDDSEVVEAYDDSHPLMIPKLPATPRTTTDGPAETVTISYSYSNAGKPPVLPRPTTGYRPSVSNTYFQATTTTTAKPGRTTIGPSGDIYDEVEEDIPPQKPIAPPRPISPPRPVQMSPQIPSKPSSSNSEYSIQPSISSNCYEVVLQVPVDAKQVLLKTESPEFRVFGDGDPANRIRQVQPGVYEVNIGATSGIKFRQYPQFQHKDADKLALDIAKGFNYGDLVPKPANRGATDLRDATLNNPYLPLVSIESAQDVGSVELVTVGADSHELSQEQRALLGLVPSWKKVLLYY